MALLENDAWNVFVCIFEDFKTNRNIGKQKKRTVDPWTLDPGPWTQDPGPGTQPPLPGQASPIYSACRA